MSAQDLDNARFWAARAGDNITVDQRHAYTGVASTWAYIAWVDAQSTPREIRDKRGNRV